MIVPSNCIALRQRIVPPFYRPFGDWSSASV